MAAITLSQNEVISSLTNMIISTQVFAENVSNKATKLVDMAKKDVGLFGDRKRYIASDALNTYAWGNDSEAANLLNLNRPKAPYEEIVIIDTFRQCFVTTDEYMSKRAFADEGTFSVFNSVVLGWLNDTKRIHEGTLYNARVGTTVATGTAQNVTVTLPAAGVGNADAEAKARLDGLTICEAVANLIEEIEDPTRDYNDKGFLRSYAREDLIVVWNRKFSNKIKYIDLPTVFHNDNLFKFDNTLPSKYFGTVITASNIGSYSASTPSAGKPIDSDDGTYTPGVGNANGKIITMIETSVTVGGTKYDLFPGDEIPAGATVKTASGDFGPGEVAIVDSKVICKIYHKDALPFLASFTASTEFVNPRALNKNNYLTFGYSSNKRILDKPFCTVKTT